MLIHKFDYRIPIQGLAPPRNFAYIPFTGNPSKKPSKASSKLKETFADSHAAIIGALHQLLNMCELSELCTNFDTIILGNLLILYSPLNIHGKKLK